MKEIFSRDHDVSDLFVLYFLKPEKVNDQRKVFYNILDSLLKKEYLLEIID